MTFYRKIMDVLSVFSLLLILAIFWIVILCINFSGNPFFYCTDMYSDMVYAAEVWNQKNIFPDGWVFGNQLYVVATPVLAALFYGLLQDSCVAMGMASTLMGLGVVISFFWMLKPLFENLCDRLAAVVCFMLVVFLVGDPVNATNGWQLFFTMCSYYACYAITIFLAFGCYLRSNVKKTLGFWVIFAVTCLLSFGTGVQSLRQTAVMSVPLATVETWKILHSKIVRRECSYRSTWLAGVLLLFNLAGVLVSRMIAVQQNEIFGAMAFRDISDLPESLIPCFKLPFSLFSSGGIIAMIVFCIVAIYVVAMVIWKIDWSDNAMLLSFFLCVVSVVVIWAIDFFTTMSIRDIYYFLLYPMAGMIAALICSKLRTFSKPAVILLSVLVLLSCGQRLQRYMRFPEQYNPMQQVSDYLEENGITTIYSHWNFGEKVAIASDFTVQVGFWDYKYDVFQSVKYLCNLAVFDADVMKCAYVVCGMDVFDKAVEVAEERNVCVQLMKHFPETDVYVFRADQKLMR